MRIRLQHCLASIVTVFVMTPFLAVADPHSCQLITCDCAPVEPSGLKQACLSQQEQVIRNCKNQTSDTLYCGIHGPLANSLPLEVALTKPTLFDKDEIKNENQIIATLFWSIRQDANFSRNAHKSGEIKKAENILKIAKRNVDKLFHTQYSVAASWVKTGKDGKARNEWKKYAPDNLELAEYWLNYAEQISLQENTPRRLKQNVYALSGKLYEMAGTAYGFSGKEINAAKAWKKASEVSSQALVLVESAREFDELEANQIKLQAAARLNRASFHWLRADSKEDAEAALKISLAFKSQKLLLEEILAETNEDAEAANASRIGGNKR